MANLNRKWEPVVAFGCSHGHLSNKKFTNSILGFTERFKPKHRIHLGDAFDFTAFRSGAKGTKDEAEPVDCDLNGGRELLKRFRPTVFCVGNHEDRAYKLSSHHNEIIRLAAKSVVQDIEEPLIACKAIIIPYTVHSNGWYKLGGFSWGHGHLFAENYLRDTAEAWGNTVVAHAHRAGIAKGRRSDNPTCYGVGTSCDIQKMSYAKGRRATLAWSYGMVFGHVSGDKASLCLAEWSQGETEFKMPL